MTTIQSHRINPALSPGAPNPSADISDRSPWLFSYTRPVRKGWYECRYWSDRMRAWSSGVMRYWDGRCWRFAADRIRMAVCAITPAAPSASCG